MHPAPRDLEDGVSDPKANILGSFQVSRFSAYEKFPFLIYAATLSTFYGSFSLTGIPRALLFQCRER